MRLASSFRRPKTNPRLPALALASAMLLAQAEARAQAAPSAPGAEAPANDPRTAPVVMPKIVHFENAPYPPAARAKGLEAEVLLKLTIERDGSVSAVEVLTPRGSGFDEAAKDAALKFKFEPATRNGEPIRVAIQYAYRFTLEEAPPPADAPPPDRGELGGVLRISGTDAAVAGIEIVLTLPDGTEQRVMTDESGRFEIEAAPPGKYRVRVAPPGFRELFAEETVAAGEATDVVYRIVPEASGLEIVVEGERPAREVTRRTIQRREIERVPGTGGDALRALQSLPGVGRPPGLAGLLIVRGASPDDTNVFADGTLIPLAYHFGGLSSVVPTELLERIDFYPSNFSARFGRVMGGVVDVGLRSPNTRCYEDYGKPSERTGCYHGLFQVDLIDARALLQGPIGNSKYWSFAVGGRRSWLDTWLKPVLEEAGNTVSSAPVYYDYQAIVDYNKGSSRFSLRGYGSDDRLELIITDPFAQDPGFGGNLRFGTSFYRVQALYEDQLSRAVSITSMASVGKDSVDFSVGTYFFNFQFYPIYLRHEFAIAATEGIKANFGLDFLTQPFEVDVRAPPLPEDREPVTATGSPALETHVKSTLFRPGWYGELEIQPSQRLRVVPGARVDFARDSGHPDFSPRLNARYDLVQGATPEDAAEGRSKRRTTVKGGIGLYHQPPQPEETNEVFGTPNLKSNRSVHYALGIEQEFTDQIELSVEGFYKDMTNQVARETSSEDFANIGEGSVVGMEAMLKYNPDHRFFGWVAYTLLRSVRKDSPDGEEYPFEWGQTHNLIALGSYRLGRGWEFGARFRLTSGFPRTPAVKPPDLPSLYSPDAAAYVPIQGKAWSERLPLSHQLDIRVDKRWQFKDWKFSTYLDIQNTYSHQAVEDFSYNFNYSQRQYQTGLPLIPSLGVRGEF
jgi:TonB family protein